MLFVRCMDQINRVITWIVAMALAAVTLIVFYQVIVRFVLTTMDIQISATWSEETARYLMIWIILIGGGLAARKGKLIAVEAVVQAVPNSIGKGLRILAYITSLIFYTWISLIGIEWVQFGRAETSPATGISMMYVYLSLPVAGIFMLMNTIVLIIESVKNRKVVETEEEKIIHKDLNEISS